MAGNVIVKMLPFRDPHSSNGGNSNAAHIDYIGKRPGADRSLTDGTMTKTMLASAIVAQEKEISSNSQYIAYTGTRPGTVIQGVHGVHLADHGLFSEFGIPDMKAVEAEVRSLKNSPMYRMVISLTDKTASELGYTNKEAWETLVRSQILLLAANMQIPEGRLNWVAALHLKDGHPHLHLSVWDREDKAREKGLNVLPLKNLNNIRAGITKAVYADRRLELYALKNASRNYITEMVKNDLKSVNALFAKMDNFPMPASMPSPRAADLSFLSSQLMRLSTVLPGHGRTGYAFMPEDVKKQVDDIAQSLLENPLYVEQLKSIKNAVASLTSQFTTQQDKIQESVNNATADIQKRVSQLILKAAAGIQSEQTKASVMSSIPILLGLSKQIFLSPKDTLSFIRQLSAAGVDPHTSAIVCNKIFSASSISLAYTIVGLDKNSSVEDLIQNISLKKHTIQPDEWKGLIDKIESSEAKAILKSELLNQKMAATVGLSLMRSIYGLLKNHKSQNKRTDNFFLRDKGKKKQRDSLYSSDELE